MLYSYSDGRERVLSILNTNTKVEELNGIPMAESKWTYAN